MKLEKYTLHLKSADGIIVTDVKMQSDEGIVKVDFNMDGTKIELSGECTESVFMKLSQMLEEKYEIHSCYTCRFGNFCPVGDRDNEIFCVNDFEPACKADLYFVTENEAERQKRSRTLFHVCPHFKPCDKEYFTYK